MVVRVGYWWLGGRGESRVPNTAVSWILPFLNGDMAMTIDSHAALLFHPRPCYMYISASSKEQVAPRGLGCPCSYLSAETRMSLNHRTTHSSNLSLATAHSPMLVFPAQHRIDL